MSLSAVLALREKKPDDWRYTDWRALASQSFAPPMQTSLPAQDLPPALTAHRLVFVAGCYRPELSCAQDLPAGLLSACDDGACEIHAEKEHCLALAPLELLYIWPDEGRASQASASLKLSLGQSARLTLIEKHQGRAAQADHFQESRSVIKLAENAKLVHGKILLSGAADTHYAHSEVTAEKGAFYDRIAFLHGGRSVRCEVDVDLIGQGSEARLTAMKLLDGASQADTFLRVRHLAPHGISRQLVKTVLSDKAKAAFEGTIHVAPAAQKTDAHQLGRALLLSPLAEMNARPELEIFADDVKCAHGSTIGDLDEAALFYLRARGIGQERARAMLVRAFLEEALAPLSAPEIADALRAEMERILS